MRLPIHLTFLAGLCATLALASGSAAQSSGFCRSYRQTDSNAGACPSCRLEMAPTEKYAQLRVTANNGWSADVQLERYSLDTASGSGRWQAGAGAYAGKEFSANFSAAGKTMSMVMTLKDRTVRGQFQCIDK
jgi:hypothetical protein